MLFAAAIFCLALWSGCGSGNTESQDRKEEEMTEIESSSMEAENRTEGQESGTAQREYPGTPGYDNYTAKAEPDGLLISEITVTDANGQSVDSVAAGKLNADVTVTSPDGGEHVILCMAMHDVYTGDMNHIAARDFVLEEGNNTLSISIDMEQLSDYSAYTKELRVCLRNEEKELISDYVTVSSLQVTDVEFDCYISKKTELVKGIVLVHRHGFGNTLKDMTALKQFCEARDFAIISFIDSTNNPLKNFPDSDLCGNTILQNINYLAESTGHNELRYAPIVTFGHSNASAFAAKFAAWVSDRCFGVVAYKSAYRGQIDHEEIVDANIPILIITGELDEAYGYQGQIECAEDMAANGGAVVFAQDPDAGHGPNANKSNTLVFAFIDSAYQAKVPEITGYDDNLITLNRLDMSKGFYGFGSYTKDEKGLYKYSDCQYISSEEYRKRKAEDESFQVQSWLFDEDFAKKWVEFNTTGFITLLPYNYQ